MWQGCENNYSDAWVSTQGISDYSRWTCQFKMWVYSCDFIPFSLANEFNFNLHSGLGVIIYFGFVFITHVMKLYLLQTGSVTEFLWVSVWVNYSVGNEINKKIPAFLPQIGIQVRFLKWKRLSEQTGLQTHHSYWHILLWCVFNFFGLQGNPFYRKEKRKDKSVTADPSLVVCILIYGKMNIWWCEVSVQGWVTSGRQIDARGHTA